MNEFLSWYSQKDPSEGVAEVEGDEEDYRNSEFKLKEF